MTRIICLAIGLIFIISCGKEPVEPTPINPNIREEVTSILFQTGEIGTTCEFVLENMHNNELVHFIPRGLHDTLKVDYMRMKVTFELTDEIIECEHNHPDFQIHEDSTTFQIVDIIEAEAF